MFVQKFKDLHYAIVIRFTTKMKKIFDNVLWNVVIFLQVQALQTRFEWKIKMHCRGIPAYTD